MDLEEHQRGDDHEDGHEQRQHQNQRPPVVDVRVALLCHEGLDLVGSAHLSARDQAHQLRNQTRLDVEEHVDAGREHHRGLELLALHHYEHREEGNQVDERQRGRPQQPHLVDRDVPVEVLHQAVHGGTHLAGGTTRDRQEGREADRNVQVLGADDRDDLQVVGQGLHQQRGGVLLPQAAALGQPAHADHHRTQHVGPHRVQTAAHREHERNQREDSNGYHLGHVVGDLAAGGAGEVRNGAEGLAPRGELGVGVADLALRAPLPLDAGEVARAAQAVLALVAAVGDVVGHVVAAPVLLPHVDFVDARERRARGLVQADVAVRLQRLEALGAGVAVVRVVQLDVARGAVAVEVVAVAHRDVVAEKEVGALQGPVANYSDSGAVARSVADHRAVQEDDELALRVLRVGAVGAAALLRGVVAQDPDVVDLDVDLVQVEAAAAPV